jgi:hypothetical protein
MRRWFAVVLVLGFVLRAHAWSYKEHIQLTRLAAERLLADPQTPADMKAWLQKLAPGLKDIAGEKEYFLHTRVGMDISSFKGLERWAGMPDFLAQEKVAEYGMREREMHFIDAELFLKGDQKRGYRPDLSGLPKLEDFPKDINDPRYVQAGMLPFRVEQCYNELVNAIRDGKLGDGEAQNMDTAARWAGYLAHYLEDNTQPQHATIDYQSKSYFANKRTAPEVHSVVEYKMIDDEQSDWMNLREEMWPLIEKALVEVKDFTEPADLFHETLQVSRTSYTALPMIGAAAVASARPAANPSGSKSLRANQDTIDLDVFFHARGQYRGQEMTVMQMKAHQLAWAVDRVAKTWRRAWTEAHDPNAKPQPAIRRSVAQTAPAP